MEERKLLIAYDPVYAHALPPGHRFPMLKYDLIPSQLVYEGTLNETHFIKPAPCRDEIVLLTHTAGYVNKLKKGILSDREQRRLGFPQSGQLIHREWVITQGTIDCCEYAFRNGVSLNVAGGTHHAFADRGEGFCLLNDFAVAANYLLSTGRIGKALIVDLDVHQGNGTAAIFENENRVFTMSMHGRHNYPFHKEKSDLDIELEDATGDEEYLQKLKESLPEALGRSAPDIVFFLSGVDILSTDKFGKLKISLQGCAQRDEFVFSLMRQKQIPCVAAMGGGYSEDIRIIVEAHCQTFRIAKDIHGL